METPPKDHDSWVAYAIHGLLGGITKSVVATGASSTTLWRAVKAKRIGDTELLFTVANLTGISPWLLAGREGPLHGGNGRRPKVQGKGRAGRLMPPDPKLSTIRAAETQTRAA